MSNAEATLNSGDDSERQEFYMRQRNQAIPTFMSKPSNIIVTLVFCLVIDLAISLVQIITAHHLVFGSIGIVIVLFIGISLVTQILFQQKRYNLNLLFHCCYVSLMFALLLCTFCTIGLIAILFVLPPNEPIGLNILEACVYLVVGMGCFYSRTVMFYLNPNASEVRMPLTEYVENEERKDDNHESEQSQ